MLFHYGCEKFYSKASRRTGSLDIKNLQYLFFLHFILIGVTDFVHKQVLFVIQNLTVTETEIIHHEWNGWKRSIVDSNSISVLDSISIISLVKIKYHFMATRVTRSLQKNRPIFRNVAKIVAKLRKFKLKVKWMLLYVKISTTNCVFKLLI